MLARAAIVVVPIAVGVYAARRPPFRRFGVLLAAGGVGWLVTALSESSSPLPYSIGRVAGWLVEVGLLYLILAFPTGRLLRPVDRALVGGLAIVVATLFLPAALLAEDYPAPSPWTSCRSDCPHNALTLVDSQPALVDDVMIPLRETLSVLIFVAATARLGSRMRRAGRLARRMIVPVLVAAAAHPALLAVGFVARAATGDSGGVLALAWLIALTVPATALAFLLGLARWRLFVAGALQRLATAMQRHPEPESLRATLADAFDDPGLELALRVGEGEDEGRWADAGGHPLRPPAPEPGRHVTEARRGDRTVAAIVHDAALADEPAFIDAATSYVVVTLENDRLAGQTTALLREVADSRSRILTAADAERRRVERALHEGAEQRLAALRIKLELTATEIETGTRTGDPALLRSLGADVDMALDEMRALARGIYPAPLDRGLVEALRSAALQSALPTTVLATGIGRYPRQVESTAYFCVLEALQNAAKHAAEATVAVVELAWQDGVLRIEVRDDGAGYDAERATEGVGLTGMRDRLATVGGRLAVHSRPREGTRVSATIPTAAAG